MLKISHIEGVPGGWGSSSDGDGLNVPAARPGGWARLTIVWHAAINYFVPVGYEDETGFHYGEMPAPAAEMSLVEETA
ncbi:MAG: hypothetical protein ABSA83_00460 [Verrucomicrobiota bacterium]